MDPEVDVVSMHIRWSNKAGSYLGKMRVLLRLPGGFGPARNEFLVAEFTGEDVVEIATQAAAWILELATA